MVDRRVLWVRCIIKRSMSEASLKRGSVECVSACPSGKRSPKVWRPYHDKVSFTRVSQVKGSHELSANVKAGE